MINSCGDLNNSKSSTMSANAVYFVGVDVGTGSARAALVTANGKIVKTAEQTIRTWNPRPDYYEQSSDDVWNACVKCIKVMKKNIHDGIISKHT